jgi:hypothetical protein
MNVVCQYHYYPTGVHQEINTTTSHPFLVVTPSYSTWYGQLVLSLEAVLGSGEVREILAPTIQQ